LPEKKSKKMALKSQEHGKTVPMKHKLKSRIQVRKGRTKEDEEEDGRRMLGVCIPLFVSLVVSSLLSQLKVS
jgi:hypothetical protein